jgi:peroxiredoxin
MMFRHTLVFGMTVVVALTAGLQVQAGKYNRQLDVGDQAPSWSSLPATDGKSLGLDSLGEAKAVVVVFTCNSCPVAVAYEDRLMKLAADYKDQGVALVAINVNDGEDLEKMKQRAEEKGFNFPYLRDDSQQSARDYGATCTPHVFVLGQDRKIAYMGAIDDNWQDGAKAEKHYVRDALDAVLAGTKPAETEAKQVGCGIKWKN